MVVNINWKKRLKYSTYFNIAEILETPSSIALFTYDEKRGEFSKEDIEDLKVFPSNLKIERPAEEATDDEFS